MELASCSFGQSSKVSYLQMANAVAAIVNGGRLMQPYLVQKIAGAEGGRVEEKAPVVVRQALKESTSLTMRGLMEEVVLKGGGKNAYVAGYRVGGKSGTSQKLDSPDASARISSFVGVAPADDPQVVVLICLDEPHSYSSLGGTISAPVVAEVLENTLEYLQVPRRYTVQEQQKVETTVPDLTGWEPAAAATRLNGMGMACRTVGEEGQVVSQYPQGGTVMPRGSTVLLYTSPGLENTAAQVPFMEGQTLDQAAAALRGAGLNLKASGPSQSRQARVVRQSVPPGEHLPLGSLVEVWFRDDTGISD